MSNKVIHSLYLCYFGLREPLVQTQVIPYLKELIKDNIKISLLTFEPNPRERWSKEQIEEESKKLAKQGIEWHFLTYYKRPLVPATAFNILSGVWFTWRMLHREKLDIIHARAYRPAIIGVIARKFTRKKPKLLFDMRGFEPDEYKDTGMWKESGWIFKFAKKTERYLLNKSDGFVVLTERARKILFPESEESGFDHHNKPIEVIPCCIDKNRFQIIKSLSRESVRKKFNLTYKKVFVYVGSFSGWCLTQEMADFFEIAKKQDDSTFALILTQDNPKIITKPLKERGFSDNDFLVKMVLPEEIPIYLSASDIAISFVKASYSRQASSPTKIAEYLASGLPIISSSDIGDLNILIEGEKVGIILRGFNETDYVEALIKIEALLEDKNLSEHCRLIAYEKFNLETVAGKKYRRIYRRLFNQVEEE